jgi:hypothetical protein
MPPEYLYDIIAEVKTGDVVPSVKDFEDRINSHMNDFGFSEKMMLVSKGPIGQIKASRRLTFDEQDKTLAVIRAQFAESDIVNKFNIIELKLV